MRRFLVLHCWFYWQSPGTDKVIGTAIPKTPSQGWEALWSFSTGHELSIGTGLNFDLKTNNSTDSQVQLLKGRQLQYQNEENEDEEEGFVTIVRSTEENPKGRATSLINWKLSAMEFLPEEDAVFVMLLSTTILRSVTQMRKDDVGSLLIRKRLKEAKLGDRYWGSVVVLDAAITKPNVPPTLLLRFMREHRSEWADNHIDAYSASAIKLGPCSLPGSRAGNFGGQVILPLAHTIEHEELLEVVMMEGAGNCHEDALMSRDMFLLQLRSGMDENAVGMCSELIFAPIDASFADDAPLLPSGFRIIPRESDKEASSPNRTLNLASALEIKGSEVNVNLAGLPTLVLPCGFIKNGISRLPVGFQLIGAVFDEEKLLRVKHIFEQTLQGCSFIPPLIADEFRC